MKTTMALIGAAATACALTLMAAGAATARPEATVIRVATSMTANEEVPRPTGNVSNARGTFAARVTKSASGAEVLWTMVFNGLTGPATQAHIHDGRPGAAGPVLAPLCSPCTSPDTGRVNVNAATVAALEAGTAYVNVHTATNPAGEIRGQVAITHNLRVLLSPFREIPKPKGNVRRARGVFRGVVSKTGTRAELAWTLTFQRLTGRAIGAHIHRGGPGTAGRVVVVLCGPCRSGVERTTRLRPALVEALEDGLLYVNVHTRRNPKGEIRGNIGPVPLSLD